MVPIIGDAATIIGDAQDYARDIVTLTETQAITFKRQLPGFLKNPRLFKQREQQALLTKILANPRVEKKLIQGKLRLLLKGLSDAERENAAARKKPPSP